MGKKVYPSTPAPSKDACYPAKIFKIDDLKALDKAGLVKLMDELIADLIYPHDNVEWFEAKWKAIGLGEVKEDSVMCSGFPLWATTRTGEDHVAYNFLVLRYVFFLLKEKL